MTKKLAIIGAVVVALIVGLVTTWVLVQPKHNPDPHPTVKETITATDGTSITIPNTDVAGSPRPVPVYDEDSTTTAATLTVPLVKEACPIEADGSIGAPTDYTKACLYTNERGGQAILSHSVRGPRTGVFDHLAEIPVGSSVTIEGKQYAVARVDVYPNDALPTSMWQSGRLSLVTCTLQAKHRDNPKAGWTHTTVATLEEVR